MRQEAQAKTCPKCRLINPPEAERCDCGWDFVENCQRRSYLSTSTMAPAAAGIGGGIIVLIILLKVIFALVRAYGP